MVSPVVDVTRSGLNTVLLSAKHVRHAEHRIGYVGHPIELQGYLWLFSITRPVLNPGVIAVQVECHEAYDEYECSTGDRGLVFTWRTDVTPQPGAPLMNGESTIVWSPEKGYKSRTVGSVLHVIKVEDLPMLLYDSFTAVCTIEVQSPGFAPLVDPSALETPTDYTLIASNNTGLRVHRQLLQLASTVFSGMLSEVHNSASVQLPESEEDIRTLLTYVYPIKPKPLLTLRRAGIVARLADKYDLAASVEPHLAALFTHTYSFSVDPSSFGYVLKWLELGDRLDSEGALVHRCVEYVSKHARGLVWGKQAKVEVLKQLSTSTTMKLLAHAT